MVVAQVDTARGDHSRCDGCRCDRPAHGQAGPHARRLSIQVFATTHSWDCIQGFQQVAQEDEQSDGFLVRLGRKQGNIVATVYNEEELAIVTREQIEVR